METTTAQRTDIWTVTAKEESEARAWWVKSTQAEKEAFGLYFRTRAGYRWGAMNGTETARIALTLINAGVICQPTQADEAEANANMLAFVRTLPGMEQCLGGENDWSRWNCTMVYDHKLFEGWGSSFASAYADLVKQIVELYA